MRGLKRFFGILLTGILLLGVGLSPVQARPVAQGSAPDDTGANDSTLSAAGSSQDPLKDFKIERHSETGMVRFLTSRSGEPLAQPKALAAGASAEQAALNFLSEYGALFGVDDPQSQLRLMRQSDVENGRSFVRFQQVHQGIPVMGGELIVQLEASRSVRSVSGEALPQLQLQTQARFSSEKAVEAALGLVERNYGYPAAELQSNQPELWIYNPMLLGAPGPRFSTLVWRMEVSGTQTPDVRELVLIDATLGSLVLNFNQVDSLKYRMVYDNANTYIENGLPGAGPVRVEGGLATGIYDADRAYDYSGWTYDFYMSLHKRDSIDNKGMPLVSTVRYCPSALSCPYENAFWNGSQMVYGSGYASADDVVAHELTHGVTEHESNLFYYMQSGAINESFSDIWGELIDLAYDDSHTNDDPSVRWLLGEDVPDGAIRSMSDPTAFSDPDKMTSPLYWCGTADNGGVHHNSGVANKAAYLMVDGGTFNGYTVSALGAVKTARIFYEVQTHLLTSASDYQDLNSALIQACKNLVGYADYGITDANCNEVSKAAAAVEMSKQPPLCTVSAPIQCTNYIFYNSFNSESAGWTPQSGTWASDAATYYTQGAPDTFSSSAKTSSKYGDFDFQVYLRRTGGNSANGVMVRGIPSPFGAENRWHSGYSLFYTRDGRFGVYRYDNGVSTTLVSSYLNFHPAILTGDSWNKLRVTAQGDRLTFYINDVLVWAGVDNTYTNGTIGLNMYRDALSTGDLFQADYADLKGGTAVSLFKEDFENPVRGLWTSTANTGPNVWRYPQTDNPYDYEATYASSGFYNLWGYGIAQTSDSYIQMTQGVTLPANAYMTFNHAYSFEYPNYDGGVLEVSVNGGAWADAGTLFLENGYTGNISTAFNNPLKGRSAFVYKSSGMITSRLSLSSLPGANVRFRYRIGTDSTGSGFGWYVDDLDIYTCANTNPVFERKSYLPLVFKTNTSQSFHSGFNGSSTPWKPITGDWSVSDIQLRAKSDVSDRVVTASYGSQSFSNFIFSARMKRVGDTLSANRLIVRGTPDPLSTSGNWDDGYIFQYLSDGQYSVYKFYNGVPYEILYWGYTSAIIPGESWNVLKVIANGTSLKFYINDVLLWSGYDSSMPSGRVGIGMYHYYDPWDVLSIDWAQLQLITTSSVTEILDGVFLGIPASDGSAEMAPPLR